MTDFSAYTQKIRVLLSDTLLEKQIEAKTDALRKQQTPPKITLTPHDIAAHMNFQKKIREIQKKCTDRILSEQQAYAALKTATSHLSRALQTSL